MIDMTADALARLEHEANAMSQMDTALVTMREALAHAQARDAGYQHPSMRIAPAICAAVVVLSMARDKMADAAREHASMIGFQVAKYEIVPIAREPATGPIIWLTSNNYMPPLRSLDACERVWQLDRDGELFATMVESLERALDESRVYMAAPEYDNALYVVDLERWEHIDEEDMPEGADDLADEWKKRS